MRSEKGPNIKRRLKKILFSMLKKIFCKNVVRTFPFHAKKNFFQKILLFAKKYVPPYSEFFEIKKSYKIKAHFKKKLNRF